jgi:hypothetical protein
MTPDWFNFTLGFAADGPDLDTVRAVLGLNPGWVIHVEQFDEGGLDRVGLDLVFDDVAQVDDPERGWPVFIVGHMQDLIYVPGAGETLTTRTVRIPLAGAKITVY